MQMKMTIDDIQRLIAGDEHRTLELKKTTGELKDGMHAACAFLNTDGGWLIFGIAPSSLKVLGQEVTDTTQREIAQALAGLEPALKVDVQYIDVPDRPEQQVIAMQFDSYVWGKTPYTFHGCPYYKVESTTMRMPRELYEERLRAAKPQFFAWEKQPASRITLADINEKQLRAAVRKGIEKGRLRNSVDDQSSEEVLDSLRLLTDGQPNNAAAFLFGTNQLEYPQFQLRLACFRGKEKTGKFNDIQQVEGNFFELLDAGMAFFFKHLSINAKVVGFTREEHLEIPQEALREALINALCHRHWELHNRTIGIAIYDDRVEIENPGRLPAELTPETIRLPHKSYPYNQVIANALYLTNNLEGWGLGVKDILTYCQQANIPEPQWSDQAGFVTVTFIRPITKQDDTINDTINGTINGTLKSAQLTERQLLIVKWLLYDGTLNVSDLALKTNLSERTTKREMSALQSLGILRREGSKKVGKWVVNLSTKA